MKCRFLSRTPALLAVLMLTLSFPASAFVGSTPPGPQAGGSRHGGRTGGPNPLGFPKVCKFPNRGANHSCRVTVKISLDPDQSACEGGTGPAYCIQIVVNCPGDPGGTWPGGSCGVCGDSFQGFSVHCEGQTIQINPKLSWKDVANSGECKNISVKP